MTNATTILAAHLSAATVLKSVLLKRVAQIQIYVKHLDFCGILMGAMQLLIMQFLVMFMVPSILPAKRMTGANIPTGAVRNVTLPTWQLAMIQLDARLLLHLHIGTVVRVMPILQVRALTMPQVPLAVEMTGAKMLAGAVQNVMLTTCQLAMIQVDVRQTASIGTVVIHVLTLLQLGAVIIQQVTPALRMKIAKFTAIYVFQIVMQHT
jgi:hypothetical protein